MQVYDNALKKLSRTLSLHLLGAEGKLSTVLVEVNESRLNKSKKLKVLAQRVKNIINSRQVKTIHTKQVKKDTKYETIQESYAIDAPTQEIVFGRRLDIQQAKQVVKRRNGLLEYPKDDLVERRRKKGFTDPKYDLTIRYIRSKTKKTSHTASVSAVPYINLRTLPSGQSQSTVKAACRERTSTPVWCTLHLAKPYIPLDTTP